MRIINTTLPVPGNVDINKLIKEISDATEKYEATAKYDHGSGLWELEVDDSWNSQDYIILENVINLHDKDIDYDFVINDVVVPQDRGRDPRGINYKANLNQRLYPKRSFFGGFLTLVIYYLNYDAATDTFTDPVLKVEVSYVLNEDALINSSKSVASRTTTRTWMRKNGQWADKQAKITNKFYRDITEIRNEGNRRRRNIFDLVSKDMVIMLLYTGVSPDQEAAELLALQLLQTYNNEVTTFLSVGTTVLSNAIESDTSLPWLDTVIPDTPPLNMLFPGAVGQTIRYQIVEEVKGNI